MDIVATNYCRTVENIDAVRKFWSALTNLRSRTRTQNASDSKAENVLECVFHNFHTQRKQKDIVCRGWVLNPRPWNY